MLFTKCCGFVTARLIDSPQAKHINSVDYSIVYCMESFLLEVSPINSEAITIANVSLDATDIDTHAYGKEPASQPEEDKK